LKKYLILITSISLFLGLTGCDDAHDQANNTIKNTDQNNIKTNIANNQSSNDVEQLKSFINNILSQLDEEIEIWKETNDGELNQDNIKGINEDLSFVLKYVKELEKKGGTTDQLKQFKLAVKTHINEFETGTIQDVSALIQEANNL